MSTYAARIIIEGGIDLTVELNEGERAGILSTAFEARDRGLEERARREEEERAQRRRQRADDYVWIDEETILTAEELKNAFRRFAEASSSFRENTFSFTFPAPPTSRPQQDAAAPRRPRTPHTTTEALDVVKHYVGDLGHGDVALRKAVRRAKRKAHPDTGGTSADFQLVTAAEEILRRAGRI